MTDPTKYQVKLPFGSITIRDERSANEMIYKALVSTFGSNLYQIEILINRISDKLFDISFIINEGYSTDNKGTEKYRIKLGDTIRTKYGRAVTIDWVEKDGLILTFQKYGIERLEFSERKTKLQKIEKCQ